MWTTFTLIPVSASNLSALAIIASNLSSEYWTQNSTVWPDGSAFSISWAVIAIDWEEIKKIEAKSIFIKLLFASIFFISSQSIAITAQDIENADPSGQTVEFWVQYSDERLDAMMARAERFEAKTGIKVNVVHKGHYGKVQSAMMSAAGTKDIADVARGYGNAAADMYLIGASIDQSMLANSKKWGVTQDDIDDWGANWTVGYSPYFDGNPKLLHEVGKSIEILYYNADWLKELGLDYGFSISLQKLLLL